MGTQTGMGTGTLMGTQGHGLGQPQIGTHRDIRTWTRMGMGDMGTCIETGMGTHGHGWGHAHVTRVTQVGTHGHPTTDGHRHLGTAEWGHRDCSGGWQAILGGSHGTSPRCPQVATVTRMGRHPWTPNHGRARTLGDSRVGTQRITLGVAGHTGRTPTHVPRMSPRCPQVSPDLRTGRGAARAGRVWSCCGRTCCQTRPGRGRPRAPWWTPPPVGTRDTHGHLTVPPALSQRGDAVPVVSPPLPWHRMGTLCVVSPRCPRGVPSPVTPQGGRL